MPEILDVHLLRLGEVRIRPDNVAGTWRPMLLWTATARRWTDWLPVHAVVVRHAEGVLLFDTGQSPDSLTDPGYYPGGLVGWAYRRQAEFRIGPGDRLEAALASVGLTPDDVDTVVVSHLHQDHAGNLPLLPRARVVLAEAECALLETKEPSAHGVLHQHVAPPGTRLEPVTFAPLPDDALAPFTTGHDLYGDGTFVLLPTPGHTPGSSSLLVRRPGAAPLLLVGDLTYDPALMARDVVPGTGARAAQLASTWAVVALQERLPDLRVVAAHDSRAAALV
ncbi:MAG: hypothetical protein CMH83_23570 [Nocardioides sp.]|nr:hypothetical protein [Nocardioides sp.]